MLTFPVTGSAGGSTHLPGYTGGRRGCQESLVKLQPARAMLLPCKPLPPLPLAAPEFSTVSPLRRQYWQESPWACPLFRRRRVSGEPPLS